MLTDAKVKRLTSEDGPIRDGGVPGLYFFPSAEPGHGKWIYRFTSPITAKRRDMGLGSYPAVLIREARDLAMDARRLVQRREDPIEARKAEIEAASLSMQMPTFEAAARLVHEEVSRGFRNPKHADQWINTLEDYVFPKLGGTLVDQLRPGHFADALRPIWISKAETASRVRQRCDTVMKWCAAHGFIVASPVAVVGKLLAKQPGKRERVEHHPAMPWRDIPDFCEKALRDRPPTAGRLMLELLILTAVRSGELRGMRWGEVDLDAAIWTVPAVRMKAKVEHRVPLTPRCLDILASLESKDQQPAGLVFASRNGTPLSDMALTKVLRDAKAKSDVPGRIATAHGFRSSFRDWASEHGYARDLAERALAHTIRDATEAAYHRTDLLEQRRGMMEKWEGHCTPKI